MKEEEAGKVKRTVKNIILLFSVLSAFVLAYRIWFNSYALPGGYQYLTSGIEQKLIQPIVSFFKPKRTGDFSQNLKRLLKPEKIVLQYGGERRAFSGGTAGYTQAEELAEETMQHLLSGAYKLKSKETVDAESLFSVLKGKSIYVVYGKSCDSRLFSFALCGSAHNSFTDDVSAVGGYVISLHDGILNDISVYLTDPKNGTMYRYVLEAEKNELDMRLKNIMAQSESAYTLSYSFELNFHKQQPESLSKVIFEPMLLLDLQTQSLPSVTSVSSAAPEQLFGEDTLDLILSAFSINTRTMNQYVDLDNARVFIENNATLTLYPDGLLTYQTVQGGHGPDISGNADKASYDIYSATTNAVDFVTELCSYLPPDLFEHLQISSELVNDSTRQGVYKICFDYCIDGVPIRCKEGDTYYHTIEIEIENGYLQSYRQMTKTYEQSGEAPQTLQPMMNAADTLVDLLYTDDSPVQISAMHANYIDDNENGIMAAWCAVANGGEYMLR